MTQNTHLVDKANNTTPESKAHLRHELRTPINAILGYSQMLLEDLDGLLVDDAIKISVADIEKNGHQLLTLIDNYISSDDKQIEFYLLTVLELILETAEFLIEQAKILDYQDWITDIEKILNASKKLQTLIKKIAEPQVAPPQQTTNSLKRQALASLEKIKPKNSGTVLIVDDNPINRDIMTRQLERQGHNVLAAENGQEALFILNTYSCDLILLDIMMPVMNGYETLAHIKNDINLKEMPIIMISALSEMNSVVRCIEMGAEDYLPKPFDPALLKARVNSCLEKKRLRNNELEYLQQVSIVIAAAKAVEKDEFAPEMLASITQRNDELGHLGRVFQGMSLRIESREKSLKRKGLLTSILSIVSPAVIFVGDFVVNKLLTEAADKVSANHYLISIFSNTYLLAATAAVLAILLAFYNKFYSN